MMGDISSETGVTVSGGYALYATTIQRPWAILRLSQPLPRATRDYLAVFAGKWHWRSKLPSLSHALPRFEGSIRSSSSKDGVGPSPRLRKHWELLVNEITQRVTGVFASGVRFVDLPQQVSIRIDFPADLL